MTKKVLSLVLFLLIAASVFSGCTSLNEQKGEEATQKSDSDSAVVKDDFLFAEEQISSAEAAKSAGTIDAFRKLLSNPDVNVASFNGADDITVSEEAYIDKTVAIKTAGTVSINSPVASVVLIDAPKGVTLNAKADSIIVEGVGITCDLNTETGSVYIIGKDCVINIRNEDISKILVRNSTAVINNFSESDIEVTLTNGTKVTVSAGKAYDVKNNLIREAD